MNRHRSSLIFLLLSGCASATTAPGPEPTVRAAAIAVEPDAPPVELYEEIDISGEGPFEAVRCLAMRGADLGFEFQEATIFLDSFGVGEPDPTPRDGYVRLLRHPNELITYSYEVGRGVVRIIVDGQGYPVGQALADELISALDTCTTTQ